MAKGGKKDGDDWEREIKRRSGSSGRYVAKRDGNTGATAYRKGKDGLGKVSTGNDGNRHVVPNRERGGWDVVKENHERSSGHFDTQKEAIDRAREIVEKTAGGNGEIVIHGKDGKIRDSDSGSRNESKSKDTR